tara:strand:+ start:393 stop:1073 length:681 start_codon:yes stop_codon:yes gene_type:complete
MTTDSYGGLSTRYVFHNLSTWFPALIHKDEYGNIDMDDSTLRIGDIGCGKGKWGYLLRASYPGDFTLSGFDNDEDSVEFIRQRTNVYDSVGYFDYEDKLPYTDKSLDVAIAIGFVDKTWSISKITHFFKEMERISHHSIVTVPHVKGLKPKDIRITGQWIIRSFGFNIPKDRKPTTLDSIMNPFVFGFSKYNVHFWGSEFFCTLDNTSEFEMERSTMGQERVKKVK